MDEIKCILFCEFHPKAGPLIVYQVPEEYISKEDFDNVHVYIITKPQLQHKTITINAFGHKILGCPVFIDDPRYDRNKFIFNLCFAFDEYTDTLKYENVIKKLAGYFTTLEVEGGFLSNEDTKKNLPDILSQMKDKLNREEMTCCIPIADKSTTIHLKVTSESADPPAVHDFHVPIFDPEVRGCDTTHWDLATQQLIDYIDGCRHVARISAEADVDIHIVKACVQNLVFFGAVKLISVFQYCNVYVTTPLITTLVQDVSLQQNCLQYIARPGRIPSLKCALTLYCGLTAGITVQDLCVRHNTQMAGIDERRLIQFGLIYGLIRRLHQYPVKLPTEVGTSRLRNLYRWFNGCHSCDEICCMTGLSHQELEDKIESDPSVVVCWK